MSVCAKFYVNSVEYIGDSASIRLSAVVDGSAENKTFFKWTPSGQIAFNTINPEAAKQFVEGEEIYVDFTPVRK